MAVSICKIMLLASQHEMKCIRDILNDKLWKSKIQRIV